MFELMKNAPWEDMWQQMDAFMRYPARENPLKSNGLKTLIGRPHNLVNVKDKDGNIVGQRLEVVTTPFAKKDVKVSVSGNVLKILCGWDSPETTSIEENEDYIYKGISTQSYEFSLKLGDNIDKDAIKAKNEDGVLKIEMPFKATKDEGDVKTIDVE